MRRPILALIAAAVAITPAAAQQGAMDPLPTAPAPDLVDGTLTADAEDPGFPWGILGLLGLAGLIGRYRSSRTGAD